MVACQHTRAAIIVVFLQFICLQICLTAECHYVISSDLESGWFTSPNHPENYPNRANCSWLIHAKNPIIISFTHFYKERRDLLKIYDGPTTLSPLLLEVSADDDPPSVVSTTNQILITFTSDESYSFSGFNATYSSYRCQHLLSSESGSFSFPEYPLNSLDDTNCRWLIQTKRRKTFSFSQFYLENDKDWLSIYDGPTESSKLLFKGSSNKEIPSLIETTTNQALVVFSSYKSGSYSGFNATYEPLRCQYILSSESGWLKSPERSKYYPAANCSWLINATQPITLSFTQFKIENSNDSVKIYDGSSTDAVELFVSSIYQNIPSFIISSTSHMLITFTSEASKSYSGYYSGFVASYKPSGCLEISSDSGWFTSPNYPQNYPDNSRNCWVIKATNPIMLSFTNFLLEEEYDWLTIYNGKSTAVEFLKVSSNRANQALIIPGTNQMLITFTSNEWDSFSGFNATYSPCRCQEISSPDSGWFTTPNYPSNYSDNLRFCWFINATQPIKLSFNHFDVEENRDAFSVYDGLTTSRPLLETSLNTFIGDFEELANQYVFRLDSGLIRNQLTYWALMGDSGQSVRRFQGVARTSDYSIISNSNQMLVTFTSDGSSSFSGFNATYEPYRCHHILSSESGWFILKDGPLDYAPKFNCSWLINATRPIVLVFDAFNGMPPIIHEHFGSVNEEILTIYDGPTTSSALLLNSSRTNHSLVTSTTNQMLIVFSSSRPVYFSQFNVTYYASECTHYLNSESGWFSSPNYPLNYTGNINCRWYFDTKNPIIFSFHQFLLENDKDWLMIYDGPTESSDLLFKGSSSNNEILPLIETTTNQALVVFSSDKSGSYSGFNATFEPFRCQYILSSESGWFRSPKFLSSNRVANCSWIINTTQPTMFSFPFFQLNYDSDFFMIYDGPINSSPHLLTASSIVNSAIVSTNHPILITFTSALTSETTGFNATFSQCHILSTDSGWITSPNYPNDYVNEANCCWVIETKVPLKFSTNNFITEAYSDWLKIYDGPSQTSELLKSASGYDRFSVTSTGSRILVTFTSDTSRVYPGFNLTYSAS